MDLSTALLAPCIRESYDGRAGRWVPSVPENIELLGHLSEGRGHLHANKWELNPRERQAGGQPPRLSRLNAGEAAGFIQFTWAYMIMRVGTCPGLAAGSWLCSELVKTTYFSLFHPVPVEVLTVEASAL